MDALTVEEYIQSLSFQIDHINVFLSPKARSDFMKLSMQLKHTDC